MSGKPPFLVFFVICALLAPGLASASHTPQDHGGSLDLVGPVTVRAAAVAQTDQGLVGSLATVGVTAAPNGTGHVFMDTIPLTQMDMQGSARFAVRVAGAVTGVDVREYDFFFTVRSQSQIIGGPSAGGIMTVAVIAALMDWDVDDEVLMTGTINPDGTIGPVGGVPEKAAAAAQGGATRFLYPEGQDTTQDGQSMREYCERRLGIRCEPVTDVEEAVRAFTGHVFERPPVQGNATDETFGRVLEPFANQLMANARHLLDGAEANLSAADDRIPDGVQQRLDDALQVGRDHFAEAEMAMDAGHYYAAASKSFMASIQGRFVGDAAASYLQPDPRAHLDRTLDAMDLVVEAAADETRAAEATSLVMLQAVGSAQAKATEAESRAADAHAAAEAARDAGGLLQAFEAAAFAVERAKTAPWWLEMGAAFEAATGGGGGEPVDLDATVREYIETAQLSVAYAEVILEEAGVDLGAAAYPRSLLTAAREDYNRGFAAAALFEAVEAEVRANLLLSILYASDGEVSQNRVDRARDRAGVAIQESRDLGVEPLLAMSYYEFAGSLGTTADALAFYNLARTTGKLARFLTTESVDPTPSRFVGSGDAGWWDYRMPASWGAGFFAIGLVLGVGGGIAAAITTRRDTQQRRVRVEREMERTLVPDGPLEPRPPEDSPERWQRP